jgi:hypothetical protein
MNHSHSPRHEELLPAYVLGALDGDEAGELAEHLGEPAAAAAAGASGEGPAPWPLCPICAAQLRQLAAVMEGLALSAPPAPLAEAEAAATLAASRRRLMAETAAGRAPAGAAPVAGPGGAAGDGGSGARRPAAGRWAWLAAAALLVLAVGAAVVQGGLRAEIERLRGERTRIALRADALERRLAQVEMDAERLARTMAVITAPGAQSVQMAGMGSSHAAGRTWVDAADRRAVFYGVRLPPLGAGKTYQLWFIDDDDRKTSAGTFAVNDRGEGLLMVSQPLPAGTHIEGWVVTIEPSGGRPQPTGPIALAG